MTKNILMIAKVSYDLNSINQDFLKCFDIQVSLPDIQIITPVLNNTVVDVILIDFSNFEEVTFKYIDDVIDYASNKKIPIITIGSMEEYGLFNIDKMVLISEILNQPMQLEDILEVLKKYIKIDESIPAAVQTQENVYRRKHILLVDDAGIILRALKLMLSSEYEISLANSGKVALNIIKRTRPDAILLDYEMPILDGKETLEMLRKDDETKDIPVFFLTGVATREKVKAIASLKPQGYLLKPLNQQIIIETLNQYFNMH